MLNVIKTTAIATLAALSLTATLSTTANAQSANIYKTGAQSEYQTVQVNSPNKARRVTPRSYDRNNNDQIVGGLFGAVAGGVIGSQVAGRGARTEGSVIGALLGGYAGASIAGNKSRSSYNRGYSNKRSYGNSYRHNTFGHSGFRNNSYDTERHASGFSNSQGFGQNLGSSRNYKNSGFISGSF